MPPINPYRPDPAKWIDTSSSARAKGPAQRPLVALKAGISSFATPPATARRPGARASAVAGPSTIKADATASRAARARARAVVVDVSTGGLDAWLTPPESSQRPASSRLQRPQDSAQRRGSPAAKSQTEIKAADSTVWGSQRSNTPSLYETGEAGVVSPVDLSAFGRQLHHRDLLSLVEEEMAPDRPPSSGTIASSRIHTAPSSSVSGDDPSVEPPASHPSFTVILPERGEVNVAFSSDIPTPRIPDKVLEVHRRLCGQDQQQMDEIASPWRGTGRIANPTTSPTAKRKLQKENSRILAALSKEILQQPRGKENTPTASGSKSKDKALVTLSDEDEAVETSDATPSKKRRTIRPLATMSANTLRFVRSPPALQGSPIASARRRRVGPKAGVGAPLRMSTKPASGLPSPKTSSDRDSTPIQLLPIPDAAESITPANRRSPSLQSPTGHGVSSQGAAPVPPPQPVFRAPSTSVQLIDAFGAETPTNARSPSLHSPVGHGVSQAPQPDPPAQPVFELSSSQKTAGSAKGKREWKPVSMLPETLLEWGLSGAGEPDGATVSGPSRKASGTESVPIPRRRSTLPGETMAETVPSQAFPLFMPFASPLEQVVEDPLGAVAEEEAPLSLAPTIPSQAFQAVAASPVARVIAEETPQLRRSPRLNKNHSSAVRLGSAASAAAGASSQKGQKKAATSKKGKTAARVEAKDQYKLAQFGFFAPPKKTIPTRDFAKAWQDEHDLEFEEAEDAGEEPPTPTKQVGNLGPVPPAPFHPALLPAGIRELERRAAAERKLGPSASEAVEHDPPAFSPPAMRTRAREAIGAPAERPETLQTSSSQTSLDTRDDGELGQGVKDWWAQLGQRRASEFDVD